MDKFLAMAGLQLTRKPGQEVVIEVMVDKLVIVRVLEVKGQHVRLQIEAPKDCSIDRREVYDRKQADVS